MSAAPPLSSIRVLDFSRVLAGPYCAQSLADLGADVIKVERPGGGDETRGWGPPFAAGESAYYLSLNRGKRSVALDLTEAAGRAAALGLATHADVVIENFRSGGAARLGLGPEQVSAVNPSVVYCSITGFGSEREPVGRPGYDVIAQAESGLMHITGAPDGAPHKVGVALVDVLTGLNATVAVLAALRRRELTGEGELIEVSLLDSALAALTNVAQGTLVSGQEAGRHGNAHPHIVPYQPFEAQDARILIAAANDGLYAALCGVLGLPELVADPRFATNAARVASRAELVELLAARIAVRPAAELLDALAAAGVPSGRVRGVHEAFAAAAAAGDPAVVAVEHPTIGTLQLVRPPFRLGMTEPVEPVAPPLLGQHTEEVLAALALRDGWPRR